jgi:hypothetical protein
VFWAQALTSFGLWVAYGVFQARRAARVREWARAVSPALRGFWAAGLFLGGAALMLMGLLGIAAGKGISPSGLQAWAWLALSGVGLAFVHAQTLAMALLVVSAQEAVTRERAAASETSESPRNSSR